MKTVGIFTYIQYVYEVFNDLSDCQCHDRQIVAFQTQNRNSDQNAEDRSSRNSDQKSQKEAQ